MSQTMTYRQMGTDDRSQAHALFSQTMGHVPLTAGLFALGAWVGHSLSGGVGIIAFIAAFAALIGMRFAAKRSTELTVALLCAVGLLLGLAVAPTIAYYGAMDPRALWEAGGATALFIAGFGAAGYGTRRGLTGIARVAFWALLALIVLGIVLIFVHIPGGDLAYSALGLVIFALFTMFDFQRVRRNADVTQAPPLLHRCPRRHDRQIGRTFVCRARQHPDHHQRRRRPDRRQTHGHARDAAGSGPGHQLHEHPGLGHRGGVHRLERTGCRVRHAAETAHDRDPLLRPRPRWLSDRGRREHPAGRLALPPRSLATPQ